MFGSIFSYLSTFSYVMLGAVVLGLLLVIVSLYFVWRSESPAKVEKTCRYLGFLLGIAPLPWFIVLSDWAINRYGYVMRDGQLIINFPDGSSYGTVFIVGFFGFFIVGLPLLAASWLMKRKRDNAAMDEFLEMYRTLREEYGRDEAERIMEKAGHSQKLRETLRDRL